MKSTAVRREEQGQTAEKQDRTRRFRISTGHRVVFRSYTVMPINKKKINHREKDKALYIYKKKFTGKEIQLTKIHGDVSNLRNIWEMQIKILFTY